MRSRAGCSLLAAVSSVTLLQRRAQVERREHSVVWRHRWCWEGQYLRPSHDQLGAIGFILLLGDGRKPYDLPLLGWP